MSCASAAAGSARPRPCAPPARLASKPSSGTRPRRAFPPTPPPPGKPPRPALPPRSSRRTPTRSRQRLQLGLQHVTRPAPRRAERHHEHLPSRHGDLALLRVPPLERPRGFERGDGRGEPKEQRRPRKRAVVVVVALVRDGTLRHRPGFERAHVRQPHPALTELRGDDVERVAADRHLLDARRVQLQRRQSPSPARLITRTRMFSVGPTFSATRTAASAASTASSCPDVARTPGASRERRHGAAARFQLGKPAARAKRRTRVLSRRHAGDSTRWCAAARMPSRVGSLRSSALVPLYRTTCCASDVAAVESAAAAAAAARRVE